MKKVSIITINYNHAAGLKQTLESIACQEQKDYELIVIDGGSTDTSKEVIASYASLMTYWCSEKDGGIYEAQNKGIARATGEYMIFMNSGDTFYDSRVLSVFYELIEPSGHSGIIYGDVHIIREDGKQELILQNEPLEPFFWYRKTLNHQSAFIKRSLFEELGVYDLQYRISADFDFFLKVFLQKPGAYYYHHWTVCHFPMDGLSHQKENYNTLVQERQWIHQRLFPKELYRQLNRRWKKTLPFKTRLLYYIYQRPLLETVFQKVYALYKKISAS